MILRIPPALKKGESHNILSSKYSYIKRMHHLMEPIKEVYNYLDITEKIGI